jgi:hypothetical protein
MESEGVTPGASLGTDAAKPRSSLLIHADGFEVSGLRTYRGPKGKKPFGVCSGRHELAFRMRQTLLHSRRS